jgi:hypothetical protein
MYILKELIKPSNFNHLLKGLLVIISLFIVYQVLVNNNYIKGIHGIQNYLPSEQSKIIDFSKYNDFPVTLEEEVVSQMAPIVKYNDAPNMSYSPVLDGLHDAAPLDYDGVN